MAPSPSHVEGRVAELSGRWRRDLLENVVPFWLEHSLDQDCGGYYTALGRGGELLDGSKFVWLQGRAVWTWSRLHNELGGEVGPETAERWFAAARLGADWVSEHGKDAEGRIYFAVSRDGRSPLHLQRKPFSAVFHVLGALEFAEALRRRAAAGLDTHGLAPEPYVREATEYFEKLRDDIREPWKLKGVPAPTGLPRSGLAEVMCLASLAEELLAKLPEQRETWLALVRDAQKRVRLHYDAERRVFMESVDATHGVSHETAAGRLLNPGHSIEVAWFLLHLCRIEPDEGAQAMALDALEGSLELGWDKEHGGLWYMMDVLGKPLADCTVTAEHKLWWPMTEALYACMLALELTRDEKWLTWLERVHEYIYLKLCDAENGGEWFGYLRADGSVYNECKGCNYKGMFHVPRALLFSLRSAERFLGASK